MARTVTALYDSRAEAETARARLAAEVGADETRILGRDDIGALDDSGISKSEIHSFRESLLKGSYLLVADVPAGRDPERIVSLLTGVGDGSEQSVTGERMTEEARIPIAAEELRVEVCATFTCLAPGMRRNGGGGQHQYGAKEAGGRHRFLPWHVLKPRIERFVTTLADYMPLSR